MGNLILLPDGRVLCLNGASTGQPPAIHITSFLSLILPKVLLAMETHRLPSANHMLTSPSWTLSSMIQVLLQASVGVGMVSILALYPACTTRLQR